MGLGVWHVDDAFVALGTADVGEADARVTGCSFDYGAAGLQEAAAFGVEDDVVGCSICLYVVGMIREQVRVVGE